MGYWFLWVQWTYLTPEGFSSGIVAGCCCRVGCLDVLTLLNWIILKRHAAKQLFGHIIHDSLRFLASLVSENPWQLMGYHNIHILIYYMDITMDIIILCTRLKSDGELPASSFRLPAIPRKKTYPTMSSSQRMWIRAGCSLLISWPTERGRQVTWIMATSDEHRLRTQRLSFNDSSKGSKSLYHH